MQCLFDIFYRIISSKLTRVFFNIGGVSVESDASSSHQGLSAMVGLQGKASTYVSGGDVIFFLFSKPQI